MDVVDDILDILDDYMFILEVTTFRVWMIILGVATLASLLIILILIRLMGGWL